MTDGGGAGGRPVLLACSHGTRSPAGQSAVSSLVAAVAAASPEVEVRQAFVDVEAPDVLSALAELTEREVRVVPLLMSAGYHVRVDLERALSDRRADPPSGRRAESRRPRLAAALGPDPLLVEILADRVHAIGLSREDAVLLAAAGSSDPRAVTDCRTVAESLAARLGRPVTAAFLAAVEPSVDAAVAAARERGTGRIVAVSYLLAPGFFTDRLAECGADTITDPLLVPTSAPDPRLVVLVQRRFRDA